MLNSFQLPFARVRCEIRTLGIGLLYIAPENAKFDITKNLFLGLRYNLLFHFISAPKNATFWRRHIKWLQPMVVLGMKL